jgi:hypothetical protein
MAGTSGAINRISDFTRGMNTEASTLMFTNHIDLEHI